MFTLWSHCYGNLLSSSCLSQSLHYVVEGEGGGPSGGSGSEGEKEVSCCSCCVGACMWWGCVYVFLCKEDRLSQSVIQQACSKMDVGNIIRFTTHLLNLSLL